MNGSKPRSSSELNLPRPGGGLGSLLNEFKLVVCVPNKDCELNASVLNVGNSADGSTIVSTGELGVVMPSNASHCISGAGAS